MSGPIIFRPTVNIFLTRSLDNSQHEMPRIVLLINLQKLSNSICTSSVPSNIMMMTLKEDEEARFTIDERNKSENYRS